MLDWDIKSIPNLWLNSAEKKPDDQAIIHWDVMEGKHTWHNNELISAALLYTKFLIDNDVKKTMFVQLLSDIILIFILFILL